MNIVCVICRDLLVPSDNVFHTPCGHLFHFTCLIQWLERSKTCPQCRERTTEHKIHRIYFNFSNNDTVVEDSTFLQYRVDNLTFQVKLRDKDISNLTEANEKLEKQAAGLRKEVKNVESEIGGKNSAIFALKEQIKFYKQQCQDMQTYKNEIEKLKKNIENLKILQNLMDTSVDEVDETIAMTRDAATLVTYITVMKKEMAISFKKRRELRDKVKSLQQELRHVSLKCNDLSEEYTKRKELEDRMTNYESEKIVLLSEIHSMQTNARKCVCNKMHAEEQNNSKTRKEHNIEEEHNTVMIKNAMKLDDTLKLKKDDSCIIIDSDSAENTPQSIKSQGFFSKNHGIKRERSNNNLKVPSILAKRSKFNQTNSKIVNDMTFDGFGGHAKHDKFPNPISSHLKKVKEETKKKPKLFDTVENRKLSHLINNDIF